MARKRPLILAIGGSPRPDASTDKALKVASIAAQRDGADTEFIRGCDLHLPIFGSADAKSIPAVQHFLNLYQRCDGLLLASPGYHGSISGLLKNALDYTDVLRGAGQPYLDARRLAALCAPMAGKQRERH